MNTLQKLLVTGVLTAGISSAFAVSQFDPLVAAVDLGGVSAGILAVAAVLIAIKVVIFGARKIQGFIR